MINNLPTTKVPFAGITKLQGFDGVNWVDVLTLDSTIHEGWNTFSWSTGKPAYQSYQWTGASVGSCRFGEIQYSGRVSVSDTNTSTQCTPKLWIGGSSADLSPVTYTNTKTATITGVAPRYGAVQGGETITISGTNFVNLQTSVTIDGISCSIVSVTST